ncbi:nose resistant to fluoxetine protein 6-like [Topomyia yanbarensis]|uniref:nose resistant to fluoxetine protein 6-like n=1 Tax=Topomyia yanbarensis TaxID=2498891 RepID=UPI00273A7EFD|nr:nose resistant to fluoxetine protein 6-like [Topomyia yanbarensis]XP_058812733.1 nose resistant to fluoxetine protein 6-like [Topomyia yanbarensis]XP_058812734.1 nose resistant to fluoxetine protein 6-like [Topomyia yanbarensis]
MTTAVGRRRRLAAEFRWLRLLALLLTIGCRLTRAHVDDFMELPDYMKLPKLFVYDDFGDCVDENPESFVFCVVHARVLPDESSELWRNISYISNSYRNYDHSKLERGVCIQSCENQIRTAGTTGLSSNRSYAQLARHCVSSEIKRQYGLDISQDLTVYHCYTADDLHPALGTLEALFYLVLIVLAVLVASATLFDMQLSNRKGHPKLHFQQLPESKRERLLVAFSFPRNFYRLKDSVGGSIRQDLQFLEAFRAIHMFRVIMLHVFLAHDKLPQRNTFFIEAIQHRAATVVYIAEFQNYIQTFLSISGMLLVVNFLEHIRKNPDFDLSVAWEKLKARLCRIVPAYAFVIFLECAFMRRMIDGPIGQHFIGEAQANCRRWWWANLLFINNYIQTDEPCLIQSWYLAADMQLFLYGLTVMILIWRWPHLKEYIFGTAFLCAIVIPTVVSYVNNVSPAMTSHLENAHHYSRQHTYQYDIYFPFHQNIGAYSFGMLAGFIYHRCRDSRATLLRSKLFLALFNISVILYFLSLGTVYWVIAFRDNIPQILQAIYSTFFKQSWAILTTVLQLGLALFTLNSWFKRFFSHPFFGVVGKLCYSFYLIHFTIIELVYGGTMSPIYSNERVIVTYVAQVFWWTTVVGMALAVVIELPSAAALKELLDRRKLKTDKIQQTQISTIDGRIKADRC